MSSFDSEPNAKVLNNLPVIDTPANDLASLCMSISESASGGKLSIIRESSLTFRDHAKCRTLTISPPPPFSKSRTLIDTVVAANSFCISKCETTGKCTTRRGSRERDIARIKRRFPRRPRHAIDNEISNGA